LADNKATLILYWMLLKDRSTDTRASIHCVFPVLKAN